MLFMQCRPAEGTSTPEKIAMFVCCRRNPCDNATPESLLTQFKQLQLLFPRMEYACVVNIDSGSIVVDYRTQYSLTMTGSSAKRAPSDTPVAQLAGADGEIDPELVASIVMTARDVGHTIGELGICRSVNVTTSSGFTLTVMHIRDDFMLVFCCQGDASEVNDETLKARQTGLQDISDGLKVLL